jgi:hypothetical protein
LLDDRVGRVDVYVEVVVGAALERVGAGAAVQVWSKPKIGRLPGR